MAQCPQFQANGRRRLNLARANRLDELPYRSPTPPLLRLRTELDPIVSATVSVSPDELRGSPTPPAYESTYPDGLINSGRNSIEDQGWDADTELNWQYVPGWCTPPPTDADSGTRSSQGSDTDARSNPRFPTPDSEFKKKEEDLLLLDAHETLALYPSLAKLEWPASWEKLRKETLLDPVEHMQFFFDITGERSGNEELPELMEAVRLDEADMDLAAEEVEALIDFEDSE